MDTSFSIHYLTDADHQVGISFDGATFHAATRCANGLWSYSAEQIPPTCDRFEFAILAAGHVVRREWGGGHRLDASAVGVHYLSFWRDVPRHNMPLCCAPFDKYPQTDFTSQPCTLYIRAYLPALYDDRCQYAICGDCDALGGWNTDHAVEMQHIGHGCWQVAIDRKSIADSAEFKLIVRNSGYVVWECGDNRIIRAQKPTTELSIIYEFGDVDIQIPVPRFAGVAVPLFSLRSASGWGVGEITDLVRFGAWARDCGQSVIQLLPINDTNLDGSWHDSYPYSPISVFALNYIYLNVCKIGSLHNATLQDSYQREAARLNALQQVDYPRVARLKESYLKQLYKQEGSRHLQSEEFKLFYASNKHWLDAYAVFKVAVQNATKQGYTPEQQPYSERFVAEYTASNPDAVGYHYFLQYHLHKQLSAARAELQRMGISLKGDLPVGVSPQGADVWQHPQLFDCRLAVGAPPDYFTREGQNWGFPTYNWGAMQSDGFDWWHKRLQQMSLYFDMYRIDHILGFFRIWAFDRATNDPKLGNFIPAEAYTISQLGKWGIEPEDEVFKCLFAESAEHRGRYFPRIDLRESSLYQESDLDTKRTIDAIFNDYYFVLSDSLWRRTGLRRLAELISATEMLPCGEDLGMTPHCVPEVMRQLQILSLDIERIPKSGGHFADPNRYPYLSVCSTSTHDMPTLRQWWHELRPMWQKEYLSQRGIEYSADSAELIFAHIIEHNLSAPSILAILPLQDWLSTSDVYRNAQPLDSERINDPADSHNHWAYRMPIDIDKLLTHSGIGQQLRALVEASGRKTTLIAKQ